MKGDIIDAEIIKLYQNKIFASKFENLDERNYSVRKYTLFK